MSIRKGIADFGKEVWDEGRSHTVNKIYTDGFTDGSTLCMSEVGQRVDLLVQKMRTKALSGSEQAVLSELMSLHAEIVRKVEARFKV
jgi:hypothetical protein